MSGNKKYTLVLHLTMYGDTDTVQMQQDFTDEKEAYKQAGHLHLVIEDARRKRGDWSRLVCGPGEIRFDPREVVAFSTFVYPLIS
mgnify:CR=1 FL=1